jgi:cofilin
MQSGIAIEDDVGTVFNEMRMRRKHRYVIYHVTDDNSKVSIEKVGARDETWEQFKESMPKNNSR